MFNLKKQLLTLFLVFIMLFSLCIPVFAFDSDYLWGDVVPADILNTSPNIYNNGINSSTCPDCVYGNADYSIMFYYEDTYYLVVAHGLSYGATFYVYSGDDILRLNKSDNSKFTVFKFNSDTKLWEIENSGIELYDLTGYKFVKKRSNVNFNIDDKPFDYNGSNINYDGSSVKKIDSVVFTGPSKTEYYIGDTFDSTGISATVFYVDGTTEDVTNSVIVTIPDLFTSGMNKVGVLTYKKYSYNFTVNVSQQAIIDPGEEPGSGEKEDITNSGLLGGIQDFFSDVFQGFLNLVDFLWELILKIGDLLKSLYETLKKLPQVISGFDNLFGEESAIFGFLDSVFPADNQNAQSCKFIVLLVFSFGLFMFFYGLVKKFLFK